jgi:hypothetical protein
MSVFRRGISAVVETNGADPGAITLPTGTSPGDLIIFYFYSAITGADETVTLPTGFTQIYQDRSTNNGLLVAGYKWAVSGEANPDASITNHTSGNSGETVLCFVETWNGVNPSAPIGDIATSASTWAASTTNAGPIAATGITSVPSGGVLVVHAGRHDDLASIAQTTLSGDSLTWAGSGVFESVLGADAAIFTQYGRNATADALTSFTSKTITGFGTSDSATGIGRMFVLNPAPAEKYMGYRLIA